MGIAGRVGKHLAPRITRAAPDFATGFVLEALNRAITGAGPLPAAAVTGRRILAEEGGDVDKAIHEVIEVHVRYAGAQGFLTNIGGLVTTTVTLPANITGLALIQLRMVSVIAWLRGYDLDDPRVRNAVLATILGEESVQSLVKGKRLPAPPMGMATAPVPDPDLPRLVAAEVAAELVTAVAGRRLAVSVGRRVPVLGGVVGMGADGWSTWKIGRYADRELLPRRPREVPRGE